jgi:hypothetical protein
MHVFGVLLRQSVAPIIDFGTIDGINRLILFWLFPRSEV